MVAKSSKGKITLYAEKEDGLYQDFKLSFKGECYSRHFWMAVTNPAYAPQIHYKDINKDGQMEGREMF